MKYLRLFFLILLISSCRSVEHRQEDYTPVQEKQEITFPIEEETKRNTLTLLAAGDNLFHDTIILTSIIRSNDRNNQKDYYDFSYIYSEVKSLVQEADLAIINQETVMAGSSFGYSGYPTFNTPQELAGALVQTGFNIINHANNHAMDMGEKGLLATLDLWDTFDSITVIGARSSENKQVLITKNNITIGFLSYTYGLNGFRLPAGKPWLVSLINRQAIAAEIDAIRPQCDFLVVSIHWGEEYRTEPGPDQTGLAAFLAEHNVDLIIGHHPHVLQRFQSLPRPDGKETLCFYSLGNFISHQRTKERILGAMLSVTFIKEGDELSITRSELIPVVCHFEQGYINTKAYPLYLYSEELLKKHWIRLRDSELTMDFFHNELNRLNIDVFMKESF